MPSTSHQALATTVSSTAAPFRRSRKCWSSSISLPPPGCIETTAGPPVENVKRVVPVSAGALAAAAAALAAPAFGAGFQSARTVAVQLRAGAERLAKVVQPDAVAGPAAAAGGNAALAGDRERIGEARIAEGHDRFGEFHRHLAHLRDLALRR